MPDRYTGRQEPAIHPHDTLVALAEVAAAFAGFSGIVAALGHRSPSDWTAAARFRFANLLSVTVATSLLAFLPIALSHFSISSSTAWAWSSTALAFFCLAFLLQLIRGGRKVAAEGGRLALWMAPLWICSMGGGALAQVANIAGATESRGAPYVAAILALLAVSGIQFVVLALSSVSDEP
jgi:hypothetical protein